MFSFLIGNSSNQPSSNTITATDSHTQEQKPESPSPESVLENQEEYVSFMVDVDDDDLDDKEDDQDSKAETNVERFRAISPSTIKLIEQKPKMTLGFEHLTAHVSATPNRINLGPLSRFGQEYLGMSVSNQQAFYAIDSVSGYVSSGEMVLILSPNQHNASILLRALSGRLHDADLSGSVTLNGVSLVHSKDHNSKQQQGWRRIMPHVSSSDATHAPVLTVRETFTFAAECTTTSTTKHRTELITEKVNHMLHSLDLEHVADTVVGDENLRGISGGQKRRVTFGELVLSDTAAFYALEGITDGLSSQDSLHLIKLIQQACAVYKLGVIVSLLQPSDAILALFDKMLVLSESGEMNYFGPANREALESVFVGKTGTLENGGSICDLVLNPQYQNDSLVATSGPECPVEWPEQTSPINWVKRRYAQSKACADLMQKLNDCHWQAPPAEEMNAFISSIMPKTKYATPWGSQFRFISRRRFKIVTRNAVTYVRVVIAVLFGVIIGSLFSDLGPGVFGSMARTGYMFLNAFLILMLSAAITIPQTFRERVTLFKHRDAEFYSGRVAYVTQMLMDMPLSILEASLLSATSYFWVGLVAEPKHFLYFWGILIGLEFVGQALGRLLSAVSQKQIFANIMSSVIILVFGTVAGFMPNYKSIPAVLRWLSWFTPASYAFEGMMLNQFLDQYGASGALAIGNSTESNVSLGGNQWLALSDIPRINWASEEGIKIFDLCFLFFFSFFLDFLGWAYVERNRGWFFNTSQLSQQTAGPTSLGTRGGQKIGENSNQTVDLSSADDLGEWPSSLCVKDTNYFVFLKGKNRPLRFTIHAWIEPLLLFLCGKKQGNDEDDLMPKTEERNELQLLNNVNCYFGRSRMTALMGTSGAGKSTLLDVVAGYKTGGRIEGNVMLDGCQNDKIVWKRVSAYAEQMDILNPYLSTLETLRFTAACRLPQSVDRQAIIDKVVKMMELEDYLDMLIGREQDGEGLPKHARKRVTIAVQLVTLPKILFCDEPTTGLGTSSANIVMRALRRVTDKLNLITVITIHQPSKHIWDTFDDLLLLVKGGNTAYSGPMGEQSQEVIRYFSKLSDGKEPSSNSNPADYILSVVADMDPSTVAEAYQNSNLNKKNLARIESEVAREEETSQGSKAMDQVKKQVRKSRNFFKEVALLTKRHFWTQWRNPSFSIMRLLSSCLVSLYMAILFRGDKSEISGAVSSIGAIFFLVFILVIPMQSSVVHLIEDRAVMYREVTSGFYRRLAYGLGQLLSDLPFHALNAAFMFVMFYFIVGFQKGKEHIGYFVLLTFAANWVIMSLGQFYALALPNEESANGLAGLSVILSVIFMGFLITVSAMPSYWEWAYWTNLLHYLIQGYCTNELADRNYTLFLPSDILPANSTAAIFFPEEVDVATNRVARQAAAFTDLALRAGPNPNPNYDWNSSGIVALADLLGCWIENDCLEENPPWIGIITCSIFSFPRPPVCGDEFDFAGEVINVSNVLDCLEPLLPENVTLPSLPFSEAKNEITVESFERASDLEKLGVVLCLLRELLPSGLVSDVEDAVEEAIAELKRAIQELIELVTGLIGIIVDIFENGLQIPGELILLVFGWAEFEPGEGLSAPWKWWYCMFSVAMFIAGLEILKLGALQFVVWTKR